MPDKIFGATTRHEGDPQRVAILLPGIGYTAARPLFHFTRTVLAHHGWSVQEIWWTVPDGLEPAQRTTWVMEQAERAVAAERAKRLLLVGKSLGTLATSLSADRDIPGIWFTPLLRVAPVLDGLSRTTVPTLLLGGSADRTWDGDRARLLGHPYLEVPNANHGLEVDDPVDSVNVLRQVTATVSDFVAGL